MPERHVHLNTFAHGSGYHEAAWRVQERDPAEVLRLASYEEIARIAERGLLDSLFLADSPGVAEFRTEFLPQSAFDPLQVMAALAAVTEHVGLIATASTTYSKPYDLARRFASLDFLSEGRAGWNVVTTRIPGVAENFGGEPHPPHADRYARAHEYVEVVQKLWDGWDDDALVGDKAAGLWARRASLHPPAHRGERFDVASVLGFPRSPQGHPVLVQAGASDAGIDLAARFAELVFIGQPTIAEAVAFRARVQRRAADFGRPSDAIRILPALPFTLGSTDAEAKALRAELEAASSSEFRWRNLAAMTEIEPHEIDPDAPLPAALLDAGPRTSIGATVYALARGREQTFRQLAEQFAVRPGALDFTGTPEELATLIEQWWRAGAADGFTLMPMVLPRDLALFADHVVPLLQRRGIARHEYTGRTLRDHYGLARPRPARAASRPVAAA
ncbi:NtaA/DmoA family FMN-dependent monooxygenase [Conexibacter stalactiti]|uniref:NtaA/DmoA family FMN-dependent monooxygenase n=1 Tax=Conexibacter stalactiti TaxID=1940611 RepID=A0ABU4HLV0_9ACTN|nr:NtaA/DmoA family FMN-dependent monooxygenase [Conexibacter stalactiti]MDW5594280.1 NtaA/DmoA family FMN-dependent monooxygenase [Conexibacter stalactiti]MEC5034922.1 NtaA/DmoA family FMN-dependent monooxygenase [Conexibacter stalactiti]